MELIAQAATAPPEYNAWITNLVFFLVVINLLITVGSKLVGRTEKRDVKILGDVVAKQEFDQFKSEQQHAHETLDGKLEMLERTINGRLDGKLDELNRHGDERMRSLHKRINPIEARIEGITAEQRITHNQLAHIETKLDRLIERKAE